MLSVEILNRTIAEQFELAVRRNNIFEIQNILNDIRAGRVGLRVTDKVDAHEQGPARSWDVLSLKEHQTDDGGYPQEYDKALVDLIVRIKRAEARQPASEPGLTNLLFCLAVSGMHEVVAFMVNDQQFDLCDKFLFSNNFGHTDFERKTVMYGIFGINIIQDEIVKEMNQRLTGFKNEARQYREFREENERDEVAARAEGLEVVEVYPPIPPLRSRMIDTIHNNISDWVSNVCPYVHKGMDPEIVKALVTSREDIGRFIFEFTTEVKKVDPDFPIIFDEYPEIKQALEDCMSGKEEWGVNPYADHRSRASKKPFVG